ncbi:hypothetical protein C8R43DRAFT_1007267 [Mycena crocata]|nr:hypothetical protein C8R43DRAFT_1007267 [Mycena crocata]
MIVSLSLFYFPRPLLLLNSVFAASNPLPQNHPLLLQLRLWLRLLRRSPLPQAPPAPPSPSHSVSVSPPSWRSL